MYVVYVGAHTRIQDECVFECVVDAFMHTCIDKHSHIQARECLDDCHGGNAYEDNFVVSQFLHANFT